MHVFVIVTFVSVNDQATIGIDFCQKKLCMSRIQLFAAAVVVRYDMSGFVALSHKWVVPSKLRWMPC